MALGLLCLSLVLMGALTAQAQDSILKMIQSSFLSVIPLKADFQDEKFQGDWFAVGGAESTAQTGGKRAMQRVTYELGDDHSFNVTSTWSGDQDCVHWSSTLVPSEQPGQFTMPSLTSLSEVHSFIMRVVATNYNRYAIVFYTMIASSRLRMVAVLLGRTMEVTPAVKSRFVRFAKSLGFTDEKIFFPDRMEKCIVV